MRILTATTGSSTRTSTRPTFIITITIITDADPWGRALDATRHPDAGSSILGMPDAAPVYNVDVTRRIALIIAVLPLIVLVGLRSAWAAYACRLDGQVRAACCCPKKKTHTPTDHAPRLAAADCCDVTVGKATAPPDTREADRAPTGTPLLVAAAGASFAAPLRPAQLAAGPVTQARPPPRTIPTYLANRSILR